MKKLKVVVLMGGMSPEHEVSIVSGTEVVKSLDEKKYEALPVVISKDGQNWRLTSKTSLLSLSDPLELRGTKKEIILAKEKSLQGVRSISGKDVSVVFIAMHGPYGEDGTVQGMLELSGVTYTGSGVLPSAIGMDKIMFRKLMTATGIPIPKYTFLKRKDRVSIEKEIGKPPYFVKPFNQGSSVGASIVKNKRDLKKALDLSFKYSEIALVDEYIPGAELTCSVIGNDNPVALPVIEIVPLKGDFFDYESKYTESGSEEIVPARISKSMTKKVKEMAIKVYKAIGCRGFGRVDFILKDNKYPEVLEINTIPGLTPMSLLPKSAKAAGISYSSLLDKIISYAIKK
jgi:D-alanine-D-alanine ligase